MTDGKDTAAKTKPLISKENAQNHPETIQRGQVLGVSAFREQIGKSAVKRRWPICPVCRNTSREKDHTVSGMLLYAKTDEEIYPNNVYQMSGNQITVRTLDLNLPFDEIAGQLNTIAKTHFDL